jgi:gamma-glutamyltranspeptidase/glutathione hydrolase
MNLNNYPYASKRMPVLADNGAVATTQPLAAQAGLKALQNGGSAVDAAIATAAALTVLEPTSNGIGSDAFAIVWDGNKLQGMNASGRWPSKSSASSLREQGFDAVPERGWSSVTVPGAPAAWEDLHQRFGRLEMRDLLQWAIFYADSGFPVSPVIARLWNEASTLFLVPNRPEFDGWRQTFAPDGRSPRAGERFFSAGHAWTLKTLAARGMRDFYQGEVAERISVYAKASGADLTADDLAAHRSEWVEPISTAYGDCRVWEIPPNGQGIAALIALAILDQMDLHEHDHASAPLWHLQIEAMKLGFADAYRYVADPRCAEVPVNGLLDDAYISSRRALIGDQARLPEAGRPPTGGTVYLCAADRDGMMVSYIQSNYMGFGSGVVVPETGISLQNRGAGFTLEPGHRNEAAGGKRPRHTILPGFLTRNGDAVGPFGVMAGEMQPQGHLQVISGMLDHDLNPQAVLDAPRWRIRDGLQVNVEPGMDPGVMAGLQALGHRVVMAPNSYSFGRGQIIERRENGVYVAASEPRADGAAVGY